MTKMMPIGPLMIEHRLIERVIASMQVDLDRFRKASAAEPARVDRYVDFIRTYADRCHHGKEEDILFHELKGKRMTAAHRHAMEELIEDHKWGRRTTAQLVDANELYVRGDSDALTGILDCMAALTDFYPKHIEKEDKRFFLPVMDYFSQKEQNQMLQEGFDFDRGLIHEKYRELARSLEEDLA